MKTRFLRNLAFAALFLSGSAASAQLATTWPTAYTVTDIDGVTHDFDAILGSGKAIAVDMFWDACGPCWDFHEEGTMKEVHDNLLYVDVFGLEGVSSTPESAISDASSGFGDWTNGGTIEFPLANDDNVSATIGSSSYPTLFLICPNHSVVSMGWGGLESWRTAALGCPGIVTSVDESEAIQSLSVFPNPSNGLSTVNFNVKELAVTTVELLNALGQVVITENLGEVTGAQNVTINTANVESGVYIVRITSGNNVATSSLSVSK